MSSYVSFLMMLLCHDSYVKLAQLPPPQKKISFMVTSKDTLSEKSVHQFKAKRNYLNLLEEGIIMHFQS